MSEMLDPYWVSITSKEVSEKFEAKYNLGLPNIDYEKEMFIISFGSELECIKYNVKEPSFRSRGKYIGFAYFANEKQEGVMFVYTTSRVPLMGTDEAGFSPDYKGKY